MTVYRNENLAAEQPLEVNGQKVGVPLHEGEGPNEYIDCNLQNREPPAGSTVTRCNTALRVTGLNPLPGQVRLAGVMVSCVWYDDVCYGRWTPAGYVYPPQPKVASHYVITGA
jgi:hypothetical protein